WQAISLTVIEKVQIAAAILGSLFLIASISWLIWSTFSPSAKWQRQDLLFQICYGMYGFMDVVCIVRIGLRGCSFSSGSLLRDHRGLHTDYSSQRLVMLELVNLSQCLAASLCWLNQYVNS
ncbi:hypothetical protein FD754_003022, partial [Muntiacus muntjak]